MFKKFWSWLTAPVPTATSTEVSTSHCGNGSCSACAPKEDAVDIPASPEVVEFYQNVESTTPAPEVLRVYADEMKVKAVPKKATAITKKTDKTKNTKAGTAAKPKVKKTPVVAPKKKPAAPKKATKKK